jgi:hypothetical protein
MTDQTDIPRDRWGRPLIKDSLSGQPSPYTRPSTLAKAPDDTGGLVNWAAEMTLKGLVARPDLYHLASTSEADIKAIARSARDAAGSDTAANMGTVLHDLTEKFDNGDITLAQVPDDLRPYIEAYAAATAHLTPLDSEVFVVNDELECAGSLDRLYRLPDGSVVVGDVKTGKWAASYGQGAVTIQCAVYSHAKRYDPETGERSPLHADLDPSRNLLIHLPLRRNPDDEIKCDLYVLDGDLGFKGARMAKHIMGWRKRRDLAKALPAPTGAQAIA